MAITISLSPYATHDSNGTFTISGTVSSTVGLGHVAIGESIEDGPRVNYGSATVAADGTFTYTDRETDFKRGNFVATAYLTNGTSVQSSVAPYTFYANGNETTVTSTGASATATVFNKDGSDTVSILANGQTLQSNFFDTFRNAGEPENTFVFNPGHGLDIVDLFRANGTDHDTVSLPGADFGNSIAEVLRDTQQVKGVGAVIHDPTTGDTVRLTGVTKAQLIHNRQDLTFHG